MIQPEKIIYDYSAPGKRGYELPNLGVPAVDPIKVLPKAMQRSKKARLPELSEVEVVRHFTRLSRLNYGVDIGFYPLGSCTMKYNPKINEDLARLSPFNNTHPLAEERVTQGLIRLYYELGEALLKIVGMSAITLSPQPVLTVKWWECSSCAPITKIKEISAPLCSSPIRPTAPTRPRRH